MNPLRYIRRLSERGNAVLISLIVMAAAITISLGIVSLVSGEIRNVAVSQPSERAYYKSESFVEEALWQKSVNPNYQVNDAATLGNNLYVCDSAYAQQHSPDRCFLKDGKQTSQYLKLFSASTSPTSSQFGLTQDVPQQVDPDTTSTVVAAATVNVTEIAPSDLSNYDGLEVTIIASPKPGKPDTLYSGANGVTNTFVDKVLIPRTTLPSKADPTTTYRIHLNSLQFNGLGESYPDLGNYNYRLRLKSLGSDASVTMTVTNDTGGASLGLHTPDFTALAATEDGSSRRGVQVVVPDTPQILNIFDYVLFADLPLEKLQGKEPANATTQSIAANVYDDHNCNGVQDLGEGPVPNVGMTLSLNGQTLQNANTDSGGNVTFGNLNGGSDYTVQARTLPAGYTNCGPNPQTVTNLPANQTTNLTFRIRSPQRVPLYRFNSGYYSDHYYTISGGPYAYNVEYFGGWFYEGIAGYVWPSQSPGSIPLYRASNFTGQANSCVYNPNSCDHMYTISAAEYDAAYLAQFGYVQEGIEGYVMPSQVTGTVPFYRLMNDPSVDHFYTTSVAELNYAQTIGYHYEGLAGYIYSSP